MRGYPRTLCGRRCVGPRHCQRHDLMRWRSTYQERLSSYVGPASSVDELRGGGDHDVASPTPKLVTTSACNGVGLPRIVARPSSPTLTGALAASSPSWSFRSVATGVVLADSKVPL